MSYPPITKEQEDRIKELFEGQSHSDTKFEFQTKDDGYYITASQMYEYITFVDGLSTLHAYLTIAQILGCTDGSEVDRESWGGCETCDYGSNYSFTLWFWN